MSIMYTHASAQYQLQDASKVLNALETALLQVSYSCQVCQVNQTYDCWGVQTGERSLLKNLGNWLGHLTIKQDKAIRHKDLDLKGLLYEAYEQGRMIAVLPFINRILEHCKESKVFKPSNPWVQSILCLAAEIYALDNLKLNLKFEIETMFRSQKDMKPSDVTASNTLGSHKRETVNNQDFGADKAPASPAQPPPPPAGPPVPSPGPAVPVKQEPDSKAPAGTPGLLSQCACSALHMYA